MSLIPEGSRLLDIGCGTGTLTRMFVEQRNADVLGIEPDRERAAESERGGVPTIQGFFTPSIVQQHGQFDVIVLADVLEHLVDPFEMLLSIKPALRSGGRVLASIPNIAHWTVRANLLFGRFDYQPTGIMDATHLRWFTRRGVKRLFESSGYEIFQFQSTAGSWMGGYQKTPLRFVSMNARAAIISKLCRFSPGLFACQHIVAAKIR
jgi:methionine biosynthesis protein MetW